MAPENRAASDLNLAIIDLPDLVQSIANQARTGLLQVVDNKSDIRYTIAFNKGLVCASEANDHLSLYHALRWLRLMNNEAYVRAGIPDQDALSDHGLAQFIIEHNVLELDALRDGVDILIEERFTSLFGRSGLGITFDDNGALDKWMTYQVNLGTQINPNSLLMEGLRIQDECGRYGQVDIGPDDILIAAHEVNDFDVNSAEGQLLTTWRDRDPVQANIVNSGLTPSASRLALLALHNQQVLHKASVAELVILADQLQQDGLDREREQVLRQAVRIGAKNPRIHLQLAYLAEQRRDFRAAADDNLQGGQLLVHQNPKIAIKALNKAREFGADRISCLQALLACHQSVGDIDSACTILLQMADCYEKINDIEQAIQCVRDAQEMGADPVACALSLARLQMSGDDPEHAIMQLQSAAHLAMQEARLDAAASAWQKILSVQPGNAEITLLLARYHVQQKQRDEAVQAIRHCLHNSQDAAVEDHHIGLRELLAKLDPEDADNHHHLAQIYQKRKDVNNAAEQLLMVAQNQERNQQWNELAATLERILDIDPHRQVQRVQLAQVLFQLGFTNRSAAAWNNAVQTAMAQGRMDEARNTCSQGLEQHPSNPDLHAQLAAIAFREANQPLATKHYHRAAHLALGAGDLEMAKIMLQQLVSLKPDDLYTRHELCQACVMTRDAHVDEQLHGFIRLAMRSDNLGLAVEHAYQRVLLAPRPAYAARAELVELLRRCNRTREELDEGQSLFQDLIESGDFEAALELQQRLVASNPENGELVMNLGEVFEGMEDTRQAIRCYRLATILFQQEGNDASTRDMLMRLADLTANSIDVQKALDEHQGGRAINWEAIQHDLAAASKQQIIDSAHAAQGHGGTDTYSQKARKVAQ